MRADASSLLDRLNQKDFRYREFHDAFADMELWPIFEALLSDERVVGRRLSPLAEREAALRAAQERPAKPVSPPPPPRADDSLFARYGQAQRPDPAAGDLRGFLGQLSNKNRD